jgi:transcriptional regulator with XRE-family HTH domain
MSRGDTQEPSVKIDGIKSYRKEFGHKVKSVRKQNGLSQEELAERSKLHRNYISDVERGQRNLSLDAILKLAMGLGIHIRDLF